MRENKEIEDDDYHGKHTSERRETRDEEEVKVRIVDFLVNVHQETH